MFPTVDPPGTPFRSRSPTRAKPTPTHAAVGTRVPKSQNAMSGVKTTYSPVMKPVLATVVSSSPAVCSPYASGEQDADAEPGDDPLARQRAYRPPGERRQHERRDREADREEGEQRIERERVLHLDERDPPDRRDADEQEHGAERSARGQATRPPCGRCVLPLYARGQSLDTLGRPLRDLRISVTDRCNFRCVYCMPKEVFGRDYRFLPRRELLSFEEIERVARVFVGLGVQKLRLTGGEPLLRRDLEELVATPRRASRRPRRHADHERRAARAEGAGAGGRGPEPRHGQPRLARRRGVPRDERRRLPGRARARRHRRGRGRWPAGEGQRRRQARPERGLGRSTSRGASGARGHTVRFIEFMDVGATNGWRLDDVVPAAEIVAHDRRRVPARARRRRRTAARSRSATATATAAARSASSPPSRSRSAATARARGSRPTGSSTPASSPSAATISARFSARARRTTSSTTRSGRLGAPHRPLLGAPHGEDARAPQGRDVLHRRLTHRIPGRDRLWGGLKCARWWQR